MKIQSCREYKKRSPVCIDFGVESATVQGPTKMGTIMSYKNL